MLTQYAHNEYVQVFYAELVGGILFSPLLHFSGPQVLDRYAVLSQTCRRRRRRGMLAFAVSSSARRFRFAGSERAMFFFAAAIVSHTLHRPVRNVTPGIEGVPFSGGSARRLLVFAVLMTLGAGTQATSSLLHAFAQTSKSPAQKENLFRQALRFNRFDAATHFDYGSMLYHQRRYSEAVSHLSYAVAHGFNTSTSYAVMAAAQAQAGDLPAAEQTLAVASRAYPRSIFPGGPLPPLPNGRRTNQTASWCCQLLMTAAPAQGLIN